MSLAENTNVSGKHINMAAVQDAMMDVGVGKPVSVDKLVAASSFASDDVAMLRAQLNKSREVRRFDYDIAMSEGDSMARAGVVTLTSRNFGYDFALVQGLGAKGFLGRRRPEVRILLSHCGRDSFTQVDTASSLAKALRKIDQMYYSAAATHLA